MQLSYSWVSAVHIETFSFVAVHYLLCCSTRSFSRADSSNNGLYWKRIFMRAVREECLNAWVYNTFDFREMTSWFIPAVCVCVCVKGNIIDESVNCQAESQVLSFYGSRGIKELLWRQRSSFYCATPSEILFFLRFYCARAYFITKNACNNETRL